MADKLLRLERDGLIATLTIDNPAKRNALSRQFIEELDALTDELAGRREVRAVIITGAGDAAFCGGADLKERMGMAEADIGAYVDWQRSIIGKVATLPMPTLAAINGIAFGGGLELALACDIRLAAENAMLGLTEVGLGVIPGAGGTVRLARLVGLGLAKELILTARRLSAAEALELHIVNRVVPRAELLPAARAVAEQIARAAPLAVQMAKAAIDGAWGRGDAEGLAIEAESYHRLIPTRDRVEGLTAFLEKRPPDYKGE